MLESLETLGTVKWNQAGTYTVEVGSQTFYVEVTLAGGGSAGLATGQSTSQAGESSSIELFSRDGELLDLIEAEGGQSVRRSHTWLNNKGQNGTIRTVRLVVNPGETLRVTVGAGGIGETPNNFGQDGSVLVAPLQTVADIPENTVLKIVVGENGEDSYVEFEREDGSIRRLFTQKGGGEIRIQTDRV